MFLIRFAVLLPAFCCFFDVSEALPAGACVIFLPIGLQGFSAPFVFSALASSFLSNKDTAISSFASGFAGFSILPALDSACTFGFFISKVSE